MCDLVLRQIAFIRLENSIWLDLYEALMEPILFRSILVKGNFESEKLTNLNYASVFFTQTVNSKKTIILCDLSLAYKSLYQCTSLRTLCSVARNSR